MIELDNSKILYKANSSNWNSVSSPIKEEYYSFKDKWINLEMDSLKFLLDDLFIY